MSTEDQSRFEPQIDLQYWFSGSADVCRMEVDGEIQEWLEEMGLEEERVWPEFEKMANDVLGGLWQITHDAPWPMSPFADFCEKYNLSADQRSEGWAALREYMHVDMAYEFAFTMWRARDRLVELMSIVKTSAISERGQSFLQRVARCYLFGLDSECVLMCRAVIDVEFEANISEDDFIKGMGGLPDKKYYGLKDRIDAARANNRISNETADNAHLIRDAGRIIAHHTPNPKADTMTFIQKTITILNELCPNDS